MNQNAGHAALSRLHSRDARQRIVAEWCAAAFGEGHAFSLQQRALRFLEEAIELYQAAGGDRETAHKLLTYIFERPAGTVRQEFGGVGVTLLAMAQAAGISADHAECDEIQRVLAKPLEHFTQRNEAKNAAGFNVVPPELKP